MFHEMIDLVHIQGKLINHGTCVRGGVTIGDVHFDEKTLFGPGFVRAYELESAFANFPRIVIDPELIQGLYMDKSLLSKHNTFSAELAQIGKMIQRDSDGLYFIDYLRAVQDEIDDPDDIPFFLRRHKAIIAANLKGVSKLNPVAAKYLWLAHYHNTVIQAFDEDFILQEGFGITAAELPLLQTVQL